MAQLQVLEEAMSGWLIGLLVLLGLCCIPVIMGIVTKCGGGTFGDGLLLFGGLVAGADALERALGVEPRCPLSPANKACGACRYLGRCKGSRGVRYPLP